jgi:hypothetical protein
MRFFKLSSTGAKRDDTKKRSPEFTATASDGADPALTTATAPTNSARTVPL